MAISSAVPAAQDLGAKDLGAKSHLDALLATVGPVQGLRVIDIGCGEGQLSRALAKTSTEVGIAQTIVTRRNVLPAGESGRAPGAIV